MRAPVVLGSAEPDVALYGNKARGLWLLIQAGAKVPATILVSAGSPLNKDNARRLRMHLGGVDRVIVRSSSRLEDSSRSSWAGAFHSEIGSVETVGEMAQKVRDHAQSLVLAGHPEGIPLLVQPLLTGVGGVYLYDRGSGSDSFLLSRFGPAAVTSGTCDSQDQIAADSPLFRSTLRGCRDLARRLGGSVDLELLVKDGEVVFLQYRPLTRPLPTRDSVDGLSVYFPGWLPPLCGTLWSSALSGVLDASVRYVDGLILGLEASDVTEEEPSELEETELASAERFYAEVLFPAWDARLRDLARCVSSANPTEAYREAVRSWRLFLDDYFNNPHERTVSSARSLAPPGASLSPRGLRRFTALKHAVGAIGEVRETLAWEEVLLLAPVRDYLCRYGFLPLEGHDFSQPTLEEAPELLREGLHSLHAGICLAVERNPATLLRVAWLAADDNEYKSRFSSLLRKAIMRLGDYLAHDGPLLDRHSIWSYTADEIDQALENRVLPNSRDPTLAKLGESSSNTQCQLYSAVVLAPGTASGRTTRGQGGTGEILVRRVIEERDYPLLLNSSGAVVALGSQLCHAAIFARDIGRPVYRCPALVGSVVEGTVVILEDQPACIRVEG